jgi:hypothetical protein
MSISLQVSVLGCVCILLRGSSAAVIPPPLHVELQVLTCALAHLSSACCNLHKQEPGLVGSSGAARVFEACTSCLVDLASSSHVTRLVLAPDVVSLLRARGSCRNSSPLDASCLPTMASMLEQGEEVTLSTRALHEKLLRLTQVCRGSLVTVHTVALLNIEPLGSLILGGNT